MERGKFIDPDFNAPKPGFEQLEIRLRESITNLDQKIQDAGIESPNIVDECVAERKRVSRVILAIHARDGITIAEFLEGETIGDMMSAGIGIPGFGKPIMRNRSGESFYRERAEANIDMLEEVSRPQADRLRWILNRK